jgi:hypothetical protein
MIMATENSKKSEKDELSKLRGKHAATAAKTFLRILQIEEYNKHRNDNFDASLKKYESELAQKFSDLTESRKKGLLESFTRSYYKPEFNLIAEYQAKQEQWTALKEKGGGLSAAEKKAFSELNAIVEMNEYEYVGARIMDNDVFAQMKDSMSPEDVRVINKKINDPIKELQNNLDESMMPNGVQRRHAATIEYFSSSKPELKAEIEALKRNVKTDEGMEPLKQASALLRAGLVLQNPSGYFVSKGIAAIMSTKTMQPFAKGIKSAVDNVVERSGLKERLKQRLSKMSPVGGALVAGGLAVAAFGTLAVTGVIDPSAALDMGLNVYNYLTDADGLDGFANSENLDLDAEMDIEPGSENNDAGKPALEESNASDKPSAPSSPSTGDTTTPSADKPDAPQKDASASVPSSPSTGDATTPSADKPDAPQKDASASAPSSPSTGDATKVVTTETPSVKDVVAGAELPAVEPPEDSNPTEAPGASESYTVRYGDTLSELVERRLDMAGIPYNYSLIDSYVDEIVSMNEQITDPDVLNRGWEIDIMTFPTPEPTISDASLKAAQAAVTAMPDVCSPDVINALKDADLYPSSDPLSPTLTAYAQHASMNSEVPSLNVDPTCVVDEPEKEVAERKLYRI